MSIIPPSPPEPVRRSARGRALAWGLAAAGLSAGLMAAFAWWRERSLETPPYEVVQGDGAFELRVYPTLLVAEALAEGARERALDAGFSRLAETLFAKTRTGRRLNMTVPVLSRREEGGWRTLFFMPAGIPADALPVPPDGVGISSLPDRRVAAVRFSGETDDGALDGQERMLRAWMERQGLVATGPTEHAYYNSPFMPARLRRNEVLIPV